MQIVGRDKADAGCGGGRVPTMKSKWNAKLRYLENDSFFFDWLLLLLLLIKFNVGFTDKSVEGHGHRDEHEHNICHA